MVKLSIIIPLYNVEKYIGKCLDSIFSQQVPEKDFEVIVVNDGTPDNSMEIVDLYRKFSNLIIIEQENAGLSAARNSGLLAASGDYVWFVDSDDTIEPNSIAQLLDLTSKRNVDMLSFGLNKVDEASGLKTIIPFAKRSVKLLNKVHKGKDCLKELGVIGCSVSFLFKRLFLTENNLLFHKGVYHEDMEHSVKSLFLAKSVFFSDLYLYNYLIRTNGSIMTTFNVKKSKDCLVIVDELILFKHRFAINIKDRMILNAGALFMMIHSLMQMKEFYSEQKIEINQFIKDNRTFFLKHFYLLFHWKINLWALFWGFVSIICPKCVLKY